MKKTLIFAMAAVLTAACAPAHAETGRVELRGTAEGSALAGTVTFSDSPGGLVMRAEISGAAPGKHGFHVHQFGECGDAGKAAGDHYNPAGVSHGLLMKDGFEHAHAGDLGNFEVGADGKGLLEAVIPGLCLTGCEWPIAGRSVVFHEKEDDFGQPAGNAGGRAGCGPIVLSRENS